MSLRITDNQEGHDPRPVLHYWVNGGTTRFRMMPHGSQGEDFVSGDAKPKGGGTDDFVCKYRVRPKDNGSQFWIRVGRWSADLEWNKMNEAYVHKPRLRLGEPEEEPEEKEKPEQAVENTEEDPEPPGVVEEPEPVQVKPAEPIEISYYADWNFTEPIIEEVSPGDTVHTKVVFAERVPVVFTDDHTARPAIFYTVGGRESQYRMQIRDVRSGDAKIYGSDKIFLCIYTVRQQDIGHMFSTYVGEISGGLLTIVERKQPITPVPEPEPEPVIPVIPTVPIPEPVIPVGNLDFWMHGDGRTDRPTVYRGVTPGPEDFGGYVLIPKVLRSGGFSRSYAQPIEGVTVTIAAGSHAGKRAVTDGNGQYLFKGVREDALRLRVEGEHLETKEVVVYRSRPTALADGTTSIHSGDPQNIPGNILIGQRWPDAVRPMLQQIQGTNDPLFIIASPHEKWHGSHAMEVVMIYENAFDYGASIAIATFAHEIAHIWQHVAIRNAPLRNDDTRRWVDSPEGASFVEARQKDWDTVGKARIDHVPGFSSLYENAAETCAYYWTGENGRIYGDLSVTAPHRYRWAQRWFRK